MKKFSGASMQACRYWDKLEKELGVALQHVHFSLDHPERPVGTEYCVPGPFRARWKVDAYDSTTNTVYEFLGNAWHGFPPEHAKFTGISSALHVPNYMLYVSTLKRFDAMCRSSEHPPRCLYYVWAHDNVVREYVPCLTVDDVFGR